jgi:GR25 family glycosyltransferase involved in LPS biosynthesis
MKHLNVYIVHSPHLQNRIKYLNSTLDVIKKLATEQGLNTEYHMVQEPTKEFIEKNIEQFNKRVKYEKEEGSDADQQFNDLISPLNVNQISNIEKHKMIFHNICKRDSGDGKELHLIIEDDVVVGEDYFHNIQNLFKSLKDDKLNDWDILFTCLSEFEKGEHLALKDSRDQYKVLLSKSSYFIRPSLASKLAKYLEVFKYCLKHSFGKFLWTNKHIRSKVLNKHTFLEGSKMGLFPTSVNHSNFLFQNTQFIHLVKIVNNDTITDEMAKEAEGLYKQIEKFENPDILHSMGLLYYKRKDYDNAKKYMTEACEKMQANYGYVSRASEILNNAINMYQYDQKLLEECKKKSSKYSVENFTGITY